MARTVGMRRTRMGLLAQAGMGLTALAVLLSGAVLVAAQEPPAPGTSSQSGADLDSSRAEEELGVTTPRVEVPELRSRFGSTHTTGAAGVVETSFSEQPVHWRNGESWVPIDATLVAVEQGWSNGSNSFDLSIVESGFGPNVTLRQGVHEVAYTLDGAEAVEGLLLDAALVRFDDVMPGVALLAESTPTGVKETLELSSPATPAEYRYHLTLSGLTPSIEPDGHVLFRDALGASIFGIPPAWMQDSGVDPETGEPSWSGDVEYSLQQTANGWDLVLAASHEWLQAPERVYPVRIDPTFNAFTHIGTADDTAGADVSVGNTYPASEGNPAAANLNVGRQQLYFNHHTFVRFDVSALDTDGSTDEDSTEVISATLSFTMYNGNCDNADAEIHAVTGTWPTTWSWAARPAVDSTALSVSESCPSGKYQLTDSASSAGLSDLVEDWVDGDHVNEGLRIKAFDEGTSDYPQFKQFRSLDYTASDPSDAPKLSVVWTYTPVHRLAAESAVEYGAEVGCYTSDPAPPSGYGSKCRYDLYYAGTKTELDDEYDAAPYPAVVVLLHPGGWAVKYQTSNYGMSRKESPSVKKMADALAANGYLVVVPDYRQGMNGDPAILDHLAWMFDCAQRQSDNVWPPSETWSTPDICHELVSGTKFTDPTFVEQLNGAADDAVADTQSVVEAAQDLYGPTENVYVVGESAGAYTALLTAYDAGSVDDAENDKAIAGSVVIGGSVFIDNSAIPNRTLLGAAGPVQLQQYEYDFAVSGKDGFHKGVYDIARQVHGEVRQSHPIDFRSRCGTGHIPSRYSVRQFDVAMGDTFDFIDNVEASTSGFPYAYFWQLDGTTEELLSTQDMVEDQIYGTTHTPFETYVGDFNADGGDDIFWFNRGNSGKHCDSLWYGKGDGSFSRPDIDDVLQNEQTMTVDITESTFTLSTHSYSSSPPGANPAVTQPIAYNASASTIETRIETDLGLTPADVQVTGTGPFTITFSGSYVGSDIPSLKSDLKSASLFPKVYFSATLLTDQRGLPATSHSQPAEAVDPTKVLVGDFDGNGADDLFLFTATGSSNDAVWYGEEEATYRTRMTRKPFAAADFNAAAVGDFDGDGIDDVYFDYTGSSSIGDAIWSGASNRTFSIDTLSASADPAGAHHLLVGNFDDDVSGTDDILFLSSGTGGGDTMWYSQGDGTFDARTTNLDIDQTYTDAIVGQFDAASGPDDIYIRNGGSDELWLGSTNRATIFTSNAETGAVSGTYHIVAGTFGEDDGYTDLVLSDAGGTSYFLDNRAGGASTGDQFAESSLGGLILDDRTAIVGEFGTTTGTYPRHDILWHLTSNHSDELTGVKPAGGWWWCATTDYGVCF